MIILSGILFGWKFGMCMFFVSFWIWVLIFFCMVFFGREIVMWCLSLLRFLIMLVMVLIVLKLFE